MKAQFNKLVELQKQTIGASFVLSYSQKNDMYIIRFSNHGGKVEDVDVEEVIKKAHQFILDNRKKNEVIINYKL